MWYVLERGNLGEKERGAEVMGDLKRRNVGL